MKDTDRDRFLDLIRLIKDDKITYRMPKAIDIFIDLSDYHQTNLLKFIVEVNPQPGWAELTDDSTLYLELLRSILYFYSGREEAKQPYRGQLAVLIGEYCKSDKFKAADKAPVKSFMEDFSEDIKKGKAG